MKTRVKYFDTIRYLAAVWVFTVHFIAFVDSGLFVYLNRMPVGLIMYGISGKLCVAVFCVILGYFAYRKGRSAREGTLSYAAKRYLYFVIAGLVINVIYALLGRAGVIDRDIGGGQVLLSAVFLRDDILGRFWCMRPFLIGSVFCYVAGRRGFRPAEAALEIAVFILIGQPWVAICLYGVVLAMLMEQEAVGRALDRKWVQAVLVIIMFALIHRGESTLTYLLDGAFAVGLVLITEHNRLLRSALESRWLTAVNRSYMGVYLVHELVYITVGDRIIHGLLRIPFGPRFLLAYAVCLVLVAALAIPLDALISRCNGYVSRLVDTVGNRLRT